MITEQQLQEIEEADEYSLRHCSTAIQALTESYRELIDLLDTAGVLQLQDDWALAIQDHVKGVDR